MSDEGVEMDARGHVLLLDEDLAWYRNKLLTMLDNAEAKPHLSFVEAGLIVEHVVDELMKAEKLQRGPDLFTEVETLGSKEEKPAKRRGRAPILPDVIYSDLQNARIWRNRGGAHLFPYPATPRNVFAMVFVLLGPLEWKYTVHDKPPRRAIMAEPLPPREDWPRLHGAVRWPWVVAVAGACLIVGGGGQLLRGRARRRGTPRSGTCRRPGTSSRRCRYHGRRAASRPPKD